jgi:uncharacterized protein (DUF1697 family)
MPKYVAFLRAINVGGHTVKMDELRRMFEALEFANVETFIASGNVIFDAPSGRTRAFEKKIEAFLHDSLGYEVATFIRSVAEVAKIAAYTPFADLERNAEGGVLSIGFLQEPPTDEAQQQVLGLATPLDEFHIHTRELYWWCRRKFSDSGVSGAQLARALGMQTTVRNVTTVQRIAAKYA